MWRAPKLHLAAGAFVAAEVPLETIFMSMLLEQYKKIRYLETAQYVRTIDAAPDDAPAPAETNDGGTPERAPLTNGDARRGKTG